MQVNPRPLSFYTDLLTRGEAFAFSRYGDGEWACILGREGQTCDGQPYSPELAADLASALESAADAAPGANYFAALGPMAARTMAAPINNWLSLSELSIDWHSTEVFLQASLDGALYPFVAELRKYKHRLLYVGPEHLRRFAVDVLCAEAFVEVPSKNAYAHAPALLHEIDRTVRDVGTDMIGYSAGPTANVLIDKFFSGYPAATTQIDFGSVWDVYAGVKSRSYMRKGPYDWARLRRLNFEGGA